MLAATASALPSAGLGRGAADGSLVAVGAALAVALAVAVAVGFVLEAGAADADADGAPESAGGASLGAELGVADPSPAVGADEALGAGAALTTPDAGAVPTGAPLEVLGADESPQETRRTRARLWIRMARGSLLT
jgi:hypothetical protein